MPRIGNVTIRHNRRVEDDELMNDNRSEAIPPNPMEQIIQTDQMFMNKGISGDKIGSIVDTGNAGITSIGQEETDIRFWAGESFANRDSAPFRVDRAGNLYASSATIAGYKLYDAIVDPAGDGNYETIKEALDAGAKGIFLRNGTHKLSSTLTISDDGVTITGESRDGVIIQSGVSEGASYYQISVTGDDVVLKNFTKTKTSSYSYPPILVTGDRCSIIDVTVTTDVNSYGVDAETGEELYMYNVSITGNSYGCLYCSQDKSIIHQCSFSKSSGSGGYMVYIATDRCSIYDNTIIKSGGTTNYGLYIYGSYNYISNNYIESTSTTDTAGLQISGSYQKVIDNTVYYFSRGIYINSSHSSIIKGNHIFYSGGDGITLTGSNGQGYAQHIISNNMVYDPTGYGILLYYGWVIVNGNQIYGAGNDGIQCYLASGFNYAVISNNQAFYCNNGFVGYSSGSYGHYRVIWNANMAYHSTSRGFYINQNYSNIIGNISYYAGVSNSIASSGGNVAYNI